MMDIGAVYVENMMVLQQLLQLCVNNLDTLQQVSGYTQKTTLVFSHIYTFIYPGRMFSVYRNEAPPLPTILDGLSCTGNETSLLDCCHIGGRHNCYYTIGIECAGNYLLVNHLIGQTLYVEMTPLLAHGPRL